MRVLVYPHTMEIGGSQLNAIEIAAAMRDRGHEVAVISGPGPLVGTVQRLKLRHVALNRARHSPSRMISAQLTAVASELGCDLVHAYEWPPTVEAFFGPGQRLNIPVICTVMSMAVAPFLPRTMPLIVGTRQIGRLATRAGYDLVSVLEPPVDVDANSPKYDAGAFRDTLGLSPAVPLVAMVCRLVRELKLEGLLAACDAIGEISASGRPVNLLIVGDGPARTLVEAAATAANDRAGSQVVTLTGQLEDPRPAYAAADIVLGMGSSALRGMAFGKPLIVQGERGFWQLLTDDSAPQFLDVGWYGVGSDSAGSSASAARLASVLRELLENSAMWKSLGEYGRCLVMERFSLDRAATLQEGVYSRALAEGNGHVVSAMEAMRVGTGVFRHKALRKCLRARGRVRTDDFNAVARR